MNKFLSLFFMGLLPFHVYASNNCFKEVKANGKNSEVILSLTEKIGKIVLNEMEDNGYTVLSVSDEFFYSLDHNNYNTVKFFSSIKRFGSLIIKKSNGATSKLYFNPFSKFKLTDIKNDDQDSNFSESCKITLATDKKLLIEVRRGTDGTKLLNIQKTFSQEVDY